MKIKKILPFIISFLAILISLNIINCSRKKKFTGIIELVTSRHGELKLVEEKKGNIQSKVIYYKDSEIYKSNPGELFQYFTNLNLGKEDVLLFLTENENDKTCEGKFFIVSLKGENDLEVLPEFGNCNDNPEVFEENGKITFRFNSTPTELSQTVVYSDRKLEVTESKLSKK